MFWGKEIGQDTILSHKVGHVGMQLKFYTNLDMLHICLPTQVLHKFGHAWQVGQHKFCTNLYRLQISTKSSLKYFFLRMIAYFNLQNRAFRTCFTWLPTQVLRSWCLMPLSTIFKTEPCIVSKLFELMIILIWLCSYIHCLWTFIIKYCPYFGGHLSVQNVPYLNEYFYLSTFLFIICC